MRKTKQNPGRDNGRREKVSIRALPENKSKVKGSLPRDEKTMNQPQARCRKNNLCHFVWEMPDHIMSQSNIQFAYM
jgi:hypothetical protein